MPTNGLIRYYPFTSNANDLINNQDGTVSNATLTDDRLNNPNSAYKFNGINSYIRLPTSGLFNNNYSFSAWVKLDNFPAEGNLGCVVAVGTARPGNPSGGDQFMGFYNNQLGTRNGFGGHSYFINTDHYTVFKDSSMSLQKWYLITVTRSNNKFKLYVNCNLVMTDSSLNSKLPIYGNNPMAHIGMRENNMQHFNGVIDEVRIYNRELSYEEVLAIFFTESNFTCQDICIEEAFKSKSICEGDSVQIGSSFYKSNITVIDTIKTNNCDSIITTTLTIKNRFEVGISETTCNPSEVGTEVINLSASNGCDSIITRTVSFIQPPKATITGEAELCLGSVLTLGIEVQTKVDSVYWLFNGSNSLTTEINEGGIYIAKFLNECGEDYDTLQIEEIDCDCKYFIPNAFAPNGKVEDAYFQIQTENVESVLVQIFSRWGEKVFESNDKNFKWDGIYGEKTMNTNVFGYYMELTCLHSGIKIIKKGNITLLR